MHQHGRALITGLANKLDQSAGHVRSDKHPEGPYIIDLIATLQE
jgi:hypothetical protein